MRKHLLSILTFCLVFYMALTLPALGATERTYLLEDLELSITLPDHYAVFTQDMAADDPALAASGYDLETAQNLLAETNTVLYAMDETDAGSITLQLIDMELEDFSTYTDEELAALAAGREIGYESLGKEVSRLEVYTHDQTKFICLDYQDETPGYTAREYLTTYNGTGFLLTFYSMTQGEIPQEQQDQLQTIADSMIFGAQPETSEEPGIEANEEPTDSLKTDATLSPSFVYTDPITEIQFTLEAGWVEEDTKTEADALCITTFAHQSQEAWILFGRLDLLRSLPQEEQNRVDRTTLDNDLYTIDELAAYWSVNPDEVTEVTYGDRAYYCTEQTLESSSPLLTGHMHLTQLVRVENGYLYLFLLQDYSAGNYKADLESLVSSARYVNPQPVQGVLAFSWSVFLSSLLIALILYSLPIGFYRYAIRRKPLSGSKALPIILIYGIVLLVAMFLYKVALGGLFGVLLGIFPNYKMLCAGYRHPEGEALGDDDATPSEPKPEEHEPETDDFEATKVYPAPELPDADAVTQETILFEKPSAAESTKPSRVCPICGAELQPDQTTCPDCGTETPPPVA